MKHQTAFPKHKRAWIGIVASLVLAFAACVSLQNRTSESDDLQVLLAQGQPLGQNLGFEDGGARGVPAPRGWTWDQKQSGNKGAVSIDRARKRSGNASLKLSPNNRNDNNSPLSITQIIPASQFRGQKVEFSGYQRTEGNTQGILGMLSIVRGAASAPEMLFQNAGGADWVFQKKTFDVPDDPSVQLVLICMSNGKGGSSWFDDLSVVPVTVGSNAGPRANPQPTLTATINIDAANVVRTIPRTLYGANIEWRWNGLNLWQEKERRLDPKLISLTKDLGVSVIRYPGGYYADFYHWKPGVGPIDRRPEVKHEPGNDEKSRPFFGTDEALEFARASGGELMITANAGTGTAQEAGDWVKYVNSKSPKVRFWEVGNELYFKNNSIETTSIAVDPATYARRFGEFAKAMRAADPDIKLAAIGGENYGSYASVSYPNWLRTVLERQGDQIDFVAIHNAYAPLPSNDNQDLRTLYTSMLAAPTLIGRNLQTVSDLIEKYAPNRASKIKIAVTEWGPAFRFSFDSKYVDHPKTLGSALFSASVLKTFIESPKVDMAHFLTLHDISVFGVISSRNTDFPPKSDWVPTARYYAFQLFTKHFGERLLKTTAQSPTFNSIAVGLTDAVKDAPYLDVVSSLSADGRQLYIIAINKHFDRPIDGAISLRSFPHAEMATVWTLNGTGLDAHTGTGVIRAPNVKIPQQKEDTQNPRFSRGGPNEVTLRSSEFRAVGNDFTYSFPAHSATSIVLTRR